MNKAWIAAIVATLVIGLGLGVLGGVLLFDDDGDTESTPAAAAVDCDEAQAVVDTALERVTEINAGENRDQSYYAALIVEQRTITYVMDLGADCFSLQARASNVGLLEGLHALLDSLSTAPATGGAAPAPDVPADSSGIDE